MLSGVRDTWAASAWRRLADPWTGLAVVALGAMVLRVRDMGPAALAPIGPAVMQHDAAVAGVGLLLVTAARVVAGPDDAGKWHLRRWTARALLTVLLIGLASYTLDVLAYHFFATRLYAQDLVMLSDELHATGGMLRAGLQALRHMGLPKLIIFAGLIAWTLRSAVVILADPRAGRLPRPRLFAAGGITLFVFGAAPPAMRFGYFGDKPLYENVFERNRDFFSSSAFSATFRDQVLANPPRATEHTGLGRRPDIVVLIVESLSSYHSRYFSGLNDWTPELDSLASSGTALTDFYANGWTSIGGLISLMGNRVPLVPERAGFNEWGSPRFDDYLEIPDPLPRLLARLGYRTAFLGGGDVAFLSERSWLARVGFESIVGGEDPRFSAVHPRGPFNAVPDSVLLALAAEDVRARMSDAPFLLTITTFWSHTPFLAPDGSTADEATVMRATDRAIGAFARRLRDLGFFENGILFITGDHRAMEPFTRPETERFGTSAPSRVPAVVVTRALDLPSRIDAPFQQVDLTPALLAVASDTFRVGQMQGVFLGPDPRPAPCVLHARGDDRDLVWVRCGDREGTVTVAGDRTHFASGNITADDQKRVLQVINFTRARATPPSDQSPP